jgi:3'(2'), 5'-bisphosphate nucleotidase
MMQELTQAARRVGEALASWQHEGKLAGVQLGTQFKAEADQWAEELWQKELHAILPGIPIISEEDPDSHFQSTGGGCWLVDPLDGTASFAGGYRGWVTQVALMENSRPVAAVVFAPLFGELFRAEFSKGAFCNDQRLSLNPEKKAETLVDNYPEPRGLASVVMRQHGLTRYLESGSIGLKICRVADGQADVFVKDVSVRSWDLAPGDLILSEAGGALTTPAGVAFDYRDCAHIGLIAACSGKLGGEIAQQFNFIPPIAAVTTSTFQFFP